MLLTDDDLANVSFALSIRSVNTHVKLILRLFDQRLPVDVKMNPAYQSLKEPCNENNHSDSYDFIRSCLDHGLCRAPR